MKRELFLHFSFWFSFFVFVGLFKSYFSLADWGFWVGGVFGTILPDIDHVIYFYFVSPTDLTSQRFDFLAKKKALGRMIGLLYQTRTERKGLIFHTIFFQVIFFILTFWMLSSSGSLFGKGMVLAFALHLSIDQLMDLTELKGLGNWMKYLPFSLDYEKSKFYWLGSTLLLLIFGFFL
ncbi:MAG TPA: hypothetical protein VJ227_01380 [Patescibacteria group bacterium]|nr:hypothetical protein [Patescibacteria group bacterium]